MKRNNRAQARRYELNRRNSNLEGAVLDRQRGRACARFDRRKSSIGRSDELTLQRRHRPRVGEQGWRHGQGRGVIRRRHRGMAMLFTPDRISGVGLFLRMARRHLSGCGRRRVRSSRLFDRTPIRRHRNLLEQQAEKRNQRNPAM